MRHNRLAVQMGVEIEIMSLEAWKVLKKSLENPDVGPSSSQKKTYVYLGPLQYPMRGNPPDALRALNDRGLHLATLSLKPLTF